MEYLILGTGEITTPELEAALQELKDTDTNMSVNVSENGPTQPWYLPLTKWCNQTSTDLFMYDDAVGIDRILLMDSEENPDDVYEFMSSLYNKRDGVRVHVLNSQMLEIVPPGGGDPVTPEERPDHYDERHDGKPEDVPDPEPTQPIPVATAEQLAAVDEAPVQVIGDEEVLAEMNLAELKRVAEGMGAEPAVGADRRSKDTWLAAIQKEQHLDFNERAADMIDATEAKSDGTTHWLGGVASKGYREHPAEFAPEWDEIRGLLLDAATSIAKAAELLPREP